MPHRPSSPSTGKFDQNALREMALVASVHRPLTPIVADSVANLEFVSTHGPESARGYRAFGLNLLSDLDLAPLPAASIGPFDISVRQAKATRTPSLLRRFENFFWASEDEVCLWYAEEGGYLVRNNSEALLVASPDVTDDVLRRFLLGRVMALILYRHGRLVLHASAVQINGRAVLFMGQPGSGKSTLAAAFHRAGFAVLSDDLVSLEIREDSTVWVSAGVPSVSLCLDAATTIAPPGHVLPPVGLWSKKVRLDTGALPALDMVQVTHAYLLDSASADYFDQRAALTFFRLQFPSVMRYLEYTDEFSASFARCAQIASIVPVSRLDCSNKLIEIDATVARVLEKKF